MALGYNPYSPGGEWSPTPPTFPSDPFQPPIGPTIPGTPIGAGVCPPGTRCVGPSVTGPWGVGFCLGTCSPYDSSPLPQPLPQPDPSTPIAPPTPYSPTSGPGTGVCDLPTRAFCEATCGTNQGVGGNGGGGCGCGKRKCSQRCQLPNGRCGKTNKTRYYRFGDCRRGTTAGVVEPGTVCVAPRRMNYANGKALNRAIRRAAGFSNMVKRSRKALRKLATI